MRALIALLMAIFVAGCGFQLRGTTGAQLPYKTLHIALPENADINVWLTRYIESSGGTQLVPKPEVAEATFQQLYDNRLKTILSVDASGQIREFRLEDTYGFRLIDAKGRVLVPPNEITVTRDMTFDPSAVLAKDQEEALLWRDINFDIVAQIVRRLSIVKPLNPDLEEQE